MRQRMHWRGFSWTTGPGAKCPHCGQGTVCWRHLYMAQRYANFLRGLKGQQPEKEPIQR